MENALKSVRSGKKGPVLDDVEHETDDGDTNNVLVLELDDVGDEDLPPKATEPTTSAP